MGKRELAQVLKSIKRIRNPGDPPVQSATDFDIYECDLCKGDTKKQQITQCSFCGRWICKENCWHDQHLACTACASIISLAQHPDENKEDNPKIDGSTSPNNPINKVKQLLSRKKNKK